jgi:hypothetical protein
MKMNGGYGAFNGRIVTIYQVAELLGRAYFRAATAESSRECSHWFSKSGTLPL